MNLIDKLRGWLIMFSLILYFLYSIFLSDYFIRLPSFFKEVFFLPLFIAPFFDERIYKKKIAATYPILFFISIILIYSIIGIFNNAPDIGAIRYYLFPLISYIMVRYYLPASYLGGLLKFFFFFYFLMICVGYYQMYVSKDILLYLISQGFLSDELKIHRTYLFFNVPTIAGTVVGSIMLMFFLLNKYKIWLIIGFPVFIYCFSRSAFVAILISIIIYFIVKYKNNRFVMFAIVIFLITLIILGSALVFSDEAFMMRIVAIKEVAEKGINPLGKGIGFVTSSGFVEEQVVFDNDYLRFVYEVGIFGLLSYLIFIVSCLKNNFNKEMIAFLVYFLLLMYTGDIHSMYPIPVIIYVFIALIARKDEIVEEYYG